MSGRHPIRGRHLLAFVAFTVIVVAAGPRVRFRDRWVEPELPPDPGALAARLAELESAVPGLRPGDGQGIVWNDPASPAATPLSVVYLHGFSADRHEVEPLVTDLGRMLGANVYFSRLAGHGRDGAAMAEATVAAWLDDTAAAVAVGDRIGERVVLVGTSTGGTLATWAAARPEAAGRLAAVVLISPNFQPKDRSSRILLWPWGSVLARLVVGPERCFEAENELQERHWTTCYPTSVLATMMALVEEVRTMDLSGVTVPTLVLLDPEDRVVDAGETLRVVEGMPPASTEVRRISSADPSHHVLAGEIVAPASTDDVRRQILNFLVARGIAAVSEPDR